MNAALYVVADEGPRAPPPAGPVDVAGLFDAHAPFLVRTLERITGSRSHAEDLVQDAFLVAHRRREELRPDGNPRAWLYRVAMNLLHTSRRRFAREQRFLDRVGAERWPSRGAGVPDELALEKERSERVQRAVARLPLVHREVFVLFELEGLSGAEIAALLDIGVPTVWTRLHRARARFKSAWQKAETTS